MPKRIKMITGAISKSIRRQKEQRLAKVTKAFFKDGATKFGRERIDRALGSIYGHVTPQQNIGITKAIKRSKKKYKARFSLVKTTRQKLKRDADNMDFALWALSQGTK